MPVYPGDPELVLKLIQTYATDGWNMRRIEMNLHDGTHVNAPIHMNPNGKSLDDLSLDRFVGPCMLYQEDMSFNPNVGVLFVSHHIDMPLAHRMIESPPKFIGLSKDLEFDVVIEKFLLEHDIISYENLVNVSELPKRFMFYGLPLRILEGDGSPVRAVAGIE